MSEINVTGKYLKDSEGNIFSPIVSGKSVFLEDESDLETKLTNVNVPSLDGLCVPEVYITTAGSGYTEGDLLYCDILDGSLRIGLTVMEVDNSGGVVRAIPTIKPSKNEWTNKIFSSYQEENITTNHKAADSEGAGCVIGLSVSVKSLSDFDAKGFYFLNDTIEIVDGGTGYSVNDLVYCDTEGLEAVFQVTAVGGSGTVTALEEFAYKTTNKLRSFYPISALKVNTGFGNPIYLKTFGSNNQSLAVNYSVEQTTCSIMLQDMNATDGDLVKRINTIETTMPSNLTNSAANFAAVRQITAAHESDAYVMGESSFAIGNLTKSFGKNSIAEGNFTKAYGKNSHAEGDYTIAQGNNSHVQGKFNIADNAGRYAHIVGGGTADNNRSNLHTIDWDGNAWYQGNVYVKGTNQNTGSHVLIADNTLVEYKYRDKTGLLDQNNLTNYIKEKYDSSCTGVASVEYCGEPGNDVMYAVYYYQGGYLTNWQIGIYKYHSPANDDVYVVQGATRTSENGEINNVTSDTTSQAFLRYLYTTGLTNITIQYNGGGRFPEFYDCTTTYTLSGTNATCVCSGTNFSNYDSIRAKLTYSSGTVVYTDEYETSGGIVCFSKDTLIDTENGFKTIQDIEVGDKVYSYNFKTDEIELKEVDKIFNHNVNEIVSIYTEREIIKATKGHPFYIAYNQTKMAKNLKPNDLLRTKQNLFRPVKQIVINEVNNKEVYEIRVKDNNNYFVGSEGILVYNEPNIIE